MACRTTRILSMEDETLVRQSIVAYLRRRGYEMLEAENGRVGLEIFEKQKPDLVLCDLHMPEVDGFEVIDRLARISPEIPVVVISGTAEVSDAIEAVQLGAYDFITKPILDMAVVVHAIEKAIERANLLRMNREYREELEESNTRLKESLRVLEEDETAARYIQFQLLPAPHVEWSGFDFSHFLKTSTLLSGDFLDYFQIDESHVGFYIADVSGHGVSSAFVTVLLKSTLNSLAAQYRDAENDMILHPDKVLKFVNDDIARRDLHKYLTMFYAVFDKKSSSLSFSNGGQFPPPILFDGHSTRFLEDKNLPVGLFAHAVFGNTTLEMPGSFIMALSSDGVLEVLDHRSLQEKKQFLLSSVKDLDLTIDKLVVDLGLESTGAPCDDVTLMLAKKGM